MQKKGTALLTGLILIIFLWYFVAHIEDFKSLLSVDPLYLFFIALGHWTILFMNGLFLKTVLKIFDKKMTIAESFHSSLITATGNLFLPAGGGSGVQAVFLKKSHDLSYKNFLSALSGNYVIVFLFSSLIGIIALLSIYTPLTFEYVTVFIVFCLVFTVTLCLTIFGLPNQMLKYESNNKSLVGKFLMNVVNVMQGWSLITRNKKIILILTLLTAINFLALLLISHFSLLGAGVQVSFWGLVLYAVLGGMSLLANLTPGALGIKEAIYIFSSTVIGITTPQIVGAAILDRGVRYIIILFGWAWVKTIRLYKDR